ncbi:uncharacterized protein TrAFT101_007814 [Trichoderma asperellum]|uniref:uncharacterized protein n=1 Tax=Trichoderma asperellum TaxID=101201 RepID=UPI003328656D|nr:hypothetical protein TrAFT101_007814 [Trichoderma asperellum]
MATHVIHQEPPNAKDGIQEVTLVSIDIDEFKDQDEFPFNSTLASQSFSPENCIASATYLCHMHNPRHINLNSKAKHYVRTSYI